MFTDRIDTEIFDELSAGIIHLAFALLAHRAAATLKEMTAPKLKRCS